MTQVQELTSSESVIRSRSCFARSIIPPSPSLPPEAPRAWRFRGPPVRPFPAPAICMAEGCAGESVAPVD